MPHLKAAFDVLDSKTEEIKKRLGEVNSLLYVGWRHDCHPWWYTKFCPALGVKKIDILEIFPPNFSHAENMAWAGKFGVETNVILGDVTEFVRPALSYDVIFWDHGPEHVTFDQLIMTTESLSWMSKLLIYACPWGEWPQGAEGGNIHEEHKMALEPHHLKSLGMDVCAVGKSGQIPGNEGELISMFWRA